MSTHRTENSHDRRSTVIDKFFYWFEARRNNAEPNECSNLWDFLLVIPWHCLFFSFVDSMTCKQHGTSCSGFSLWILLPSTFLPLASMMYSECLQKNSSDCFSTKAKCHEVNRRDVVYAHFTLWFVHDTRNKQQSKNAQQRTNERTKKVKRQKLTQTRRM